MRELRTFFQRKKWNFRQTRQPQNIWQGNYFQELEGHIEEDNFRLQALIRDVNRNHNINVPCSLPPIKRDKNLLYTLIAEMELHTSLAKQIVFIHKEYGMFEVSLRDANVYFIPSHCLGCNLNCPNRRRNICIVINDASHPGWANVGLAPIDLLLLSKIIALENNLIPGHVKNQINSSFYCNPPGSTPPSTILRLRDQMLEDLRRLRDMMTCDEEGTFIPNPNNTQLNPPPRRPPMTTRAAIMQELRRLFNRHRE